MVTTSAKTTTAIIVENQDILLVIVTKNKKTNPEDKEIRMIRSATTVMDMDIWQENAQVDI